MMDGAGSAFAHVVDRADPVCPAFGCIVNLLLGISLAALMSDC